MTTLLKKLEEDLNIELLKFVICKQIFCEYSDNILDYRNAILVTITKGDQVSSQAIHAQYEDKIAEITTKFESLGCEVEIFTNIKTK